MANHLTKFNTQTAYQQFKSSQDFVRPNVSYCEDNKEVYFNSNVGTFTINHALSGENFLMQYKFLVGMTWQEWVNSSYNVVTNPFTGNPNSNNWRVSGGMVMYYPDDSTGQQSSFNPICVTTPENTYLNPSSTIIADATYLTQVLQ